MSSTDSAPGAMLKPSTTIADDASRSEPNNSAFLPTSKAPALVNFKDEDLDRLARRGNLNGRQIKNAVRSAQALAVNEGVQMAMSHVLKVLEGKSTPHSKFWPNNTILTKLDSE